MFWEQFFINYLSAVLAGVTLAVLGIGVYYFFVRSKKVFRQNPKMNQTSREGKQFAISGETVNVNITQTPTTKNDQEITEGLTKRD